MTRYQYYLAPMEGITNATFRRTYHTHFKSMDKYFTPFLCPHTKRDLTTKEKKEILPENNEGMYVVPQILTNQAEGFLETAGKLEQYGYREINLNQIALSKIQTFHSTFGEDNQIYSQEEILDRDLTKLFDEGMKRQKEESNQELPFYEELRTLYKTNRREYNRIEKLSLRSRTGRDAMRVDGVTLSGDTLVFLKTNFRKVFFLVSETAQELSVLDALKYFKAEKGEQSVERIEQHHKHINMALQKFRAMQDEELRNQENAEDVQNTLGAQVSTAVSLLNNFIREIDDNELYMKIVQLKTLAERGVITYIPKRLQRIQKDLRRSGGKARMTHDEALAEIVEMAKKYSPYFMAQESQLSEQETNAEIILSESFR